MSPRPAGTARLRAAALTAAWLAAAAPAHAEGDPAGAPAPPAERPAAAIPFGREPGLSAVSAAGRVLWRLPLPYAAAGATIVGDRVVVALSDRLAALDAARGTLLWERPVDGRPTAPVPHGGTVVAGTSAGGVIGVDPGSGEVRWQVDAGGPVSAPPTPAGPLVIAGTRQREVLGITAADGRLRWRVGIGGRVTARTAVLPGVVYVAAWDGRLSALDPADGTLRWSAPVGGAVETTLVATRAGGGRDVIVALREDATLVAVAAGWPPEAATRGAAPGPPRVAWTYRLGADEPAPVGADGRLFVAGRDLAALDAATGRVLWRFSEALARGFDREVVRALVDRERGLTPDELRAARTTSPYELRGAVARAPVIAGALVLITTDEGFLYAVDAATGDLRWRIAEGDRR